MNLQKAINYGGERVSFNKIFAKMIKSIIRFYGKINFFRNFYNRIFIKLNVTTTLI